MRQWIVTLLALLVVGSSAAFSVPPAGPHDAVASVRARTDALVAGFSALPRDLASTVEAGIALHGVAPAAIEPARSPSLVVALQRFYDAHDIAVDDAELAREVATLAASDARAIAELVDAVADAKLASERILGADDVAFLRDDLRSKMLGMTLRGDTGLLDVLSRADMAQAAAAARRLAHATVALEALLPASGCERVVDLPFVAIGSPCDDVYGPGDTLLILVDYGGNDVYLNNAGSGIAGVGVGIAIDQGSGNDIYRATLAAQGFGLAGVGILVDEGGSDLYNLTQFGQGFGVAGVGVLYDHGVGDDVYESAHTGETVGTKAGGLGGIGILRDDGGSDRYQQDGLDGFVYGAGGGTGLMLEYGGDDAYVSNEVAIVLLGIPLGTFAGPIQVSAEAGATAILYEAGGDDTYYCGPRVRQGCQAAGGVEAVALLLEMGGDDRYEVGRSIINPLLGLLPLPTGQGVAYGETVQPPGPGMGVLRDASGDDVYLATHYAQGYATGGLGLLLDEGGTDVYASPAPLAGARVDGGAWADGVALGIGVDE